MGSSCRAYVTDALLAVAPTSRSCEKPHLLLTTPPVQNARILYPIEDERLVGLPTCRTFRDTFGP
jgi:hypothetical protein